MRNDARWANMREQRASHRDGGPNAEHHNKDDRLVVRVLEGSVPPARSLKHLHADAEHQQRGGEQLADGRAHEAHHSTLKTGVVADALNFQLRRARPRSARTLPLSLLETR